MADPGGHFGKPHGLWDGDVVDARFMAAWGDEGVGSLSSLPRMHGSKCRWGKQWMLKQPFMEEPASLVLNC